MAGAPTRPSVVLRGTLAIDTVRRGSASEQRALVLDADDGARYLMVRLGGPSFGLPDEARHAGRRVEASGYLLDGELRFSRLDPL